MFSIVSKSSVAGSTSFVPQHLACLVSYPTHSDVEVFAKAATAHDRGREASCQDVVQQKGVTRVEIASPLERNLSNVCQLFAQKTARTRGRPKELTEEKTDALVVKIELLIDKADATYEVKVTPERAIHRNAL